MDWVPWVIRAVLIVVGIILAIIIWKGKKKGRYQEYSLRFFVIGTTAFILGVILLIVSFITDLSFFYALYLIAVTMFSNQFKKEDYKNGDIPFFHAREGIETI